MADAEPNVPTIATAWTPALLRGAVPHDGPPGLARGAIAHWGAPDAERDALLGGDATVVPLVRHGALRLTGADRIDFLHGQVSNDVRGLAVGGACAALLLDHRGRPRAGLDVIRREGDLYLAVDDGRVDVVRRSLDAHVVFDQVEIGDLTARIATLVVAGEAGVRSLADLVGSELPPAGGGAVRQLGWGGADLLLHARPRGLPVSYDVHVLAPQLEPLWRALRGAGVRPVGELALVAARLRAGIAAAAFEGRDALPQESALEARVSYRKGCYLGQEIMARIEARGTLRRSLVRLSLDGAPSAWDDGEAALDVTDGERAVGRVGSVAPVGDGDWWALAVLRNDVPEGADLHACGRRATVGARVDAAPNATAR